MARWRDDIVEALTALGGSGEYAEIYAEVAARRSVLPESWQEVIRRTIQQASPDSAAHVPSYGDVFRSTFGIGKGVWSLTSGVSEASPSVAQNPDSSQGYEVNSTVRRAIEVHAVAMARRYYESEGALSVQELGKPYDLLVQMPAGELHVEVKGSTRRLDHIFVTRNEVSHAHAHLGTHLFVVDELSPVTEADGTFVLTGGRVRLWSSWVPSASSLEPMTYRHALAELGGAASWHLAPT